MWPHRSTLALLCSMLVTACAAPASSQGTAGQGGSTGATPQVIVYIGTGGGIQTTNTSNPTAAPAASSTATSDQAATNDVKPAVGTDAIKAATPVLGGVK